MLTEVDAPPAWRCIDFISDLHLAANTPATFRAWSDYLIGTTADAVFILGDLFEVWVGDDARFDSFEHQCTEVLSAAAAHRSIYFLVGNRDFLVGSDMLAACRVEALADPCVLSAFGERVLLTHGDELCQADHDYQAFRAMVRSPSWQTEFLARPLEARRQYAREVRQQSEMRKSAQSSAADWVDVDKALAARWLARSSCSTLVHGHTHQPATEGLGPAHVRHVLSDWDLDHSPHRAEVLRLSEHSCVRLPPSTAVCR